MQKAGILEASTDIKALVDRAFVRLPTLDDSWVQSVKVEHEDKISRQQILAQDLHNLNANEIFASGYRDCCSQDVIIPRALARAVRVIPRSARDEISYPETILP